MVTDETLSRVRSVQHRRGASHGRSEGGDSTARSGIQKTSRFEPAQARAEKEGQAFRLPRGKRPTALVDRRYFSSLTGEFGIGEALAGNLRNRQTKPFRVVHVLPGVVAERLLIDVAEQVEGFDADVGSMQTALQ